MPKAGYCKECKKNVWLKEDGSCQFGHPASAITNVYEAQLQKSSQYMPFGQWFKKQTPLTKALIIGGIATLLLFCAVVVAQPSSEEVETPKKEVENTYEQKETTTDTPDTTPPELTITQPADNSTVDGSQITITGKTEPSATLRLNAETKNIESDGTFSFQYTLSQGKNTLIFTTTDSANNSATKALTVTYNPPPVQPTEYPYTASKLREPFHHTSCYWAQQIHDENRQWFSTREEAIAAGHRPCKVCNP